MSVVCTQNAYTKNATHPTADCGWSSFPQDHTEIRGAAVDTLSGGGTLWCELEEEASEPLAMPQTRADVWIICNSVCCAVWMLCGCVRSNARAPKPHHMKSELSALAMCITSSDKYL